MTNQLVKSQTRLFWIYFNIPIGCWKHTIILVGMASILYSVSNKYFYPVKKFQPSFESIDIIE